MNISVDIFNQKNIKYDWRTLYVGLKLDLIQYSDIVNYATDFLTKHPNTDNQSIIELAWGGDDINYESLLVDILKELRIHDFNLNTDGWQFEKRKWRFVILTYLKIKYNNDIEALLDKVAEVYAEFSYPEDMDSFINYLEPKEGFNPSQYSKKENELILINLMNKFMYQEHHYLQYNNTL